MSEYLTDADVAVINAARMVLDTASKRVGLSGISTDEQPAWTILQRGELHASMLHAGDALFDVLNFANASRLAPLTHEQIHMSPESVLVQDES